MKSEILKTTLVQSELHWEDTESNLAMFSQKIQQIKEKTDLIILPEMFSTGFSMHPQNLAEPADGKTFQWMVSHSQKLNTAIAGSVIITENAKFFNRMFFVLPDGTSEYYDKRHTFTYAGEDKFYDKGSERIVVEYKGWKICPLICYDLRFPVWSRNTEGYDLLIYVANWPKVRNLAWETLLRARAIENMCYCIGVNRVGMDGNNHEYIGHSVVYDVLGNQISNAGNNESTVTVALSMEQIKKDRNRFGFLNDRDAFQIV